MSVGLLERAEVRRCESSAQLLSEERAVRGQYFTPIRAAQIMARLFRVPTGSAVTILDPGAGSGILSVALVEYLRRERSDLVIRLVAIENDVTLHPVLAETLQELEITEGINTELVGEDFLSWALSTNERFDLVIQNPPYAKLRSGSDSQKLLRSANVFVPNMYAAFVELGIRLLKEGGQQVAITPRSWMNGVYYSTFRHKFVQNVGIDAIHIFESRSKVFGDAGVLQEAVIVSATRNCFRDELVITTSHDHISTPSSRVVAYTDIVTPDFIHIPATEHDSRAVSWVTMNVTNSLADLGLNVSTGKVVDFRARQALHYDYPVGGVPMVNASHIKDGVTCHPIGTKKPEWFLADSPATEKLLVPGGSYVLVKRFSAKEDSRRVVSGLWQSEGAVAFDNKLNYIHQNGRGLDTKVAIGLVAYLNSTRLDDYFRVFSGHTQVNAADLRQMRFPSLAQLRKLGALAPKSQAEIDAAIESVLIPMEVTA